MKWLCSTKNTKIRPQKTISLYGIIHAHTVFMYVNVFGVFRNTIITNVFKCDIMLLYKPEQVIKSSPNSYPLLHSQRKLPIVFVHIWLQPFKKSLAHSLISDIMTNCMYKINLIQIIKCAQLYVCEYSA